MLVYNACAYQFTTPIALPIIEDAAATGGPENDPPPENEQQQQLCSGAIVHEPFIHIGGTHTCTQLRCLMVKLFIYMWISKMLTNTICIIHCVYICCGSAIDCC
jgi:hypothetical protein